MFETRAPEASRTESGQSAPNRLVGFIAGRRTKWLVRVLWIVALVGLSPFSSKLTGAQKNDAVQYLPSSAESTKVFNQTKAFIGDSIPTSIIYQRTTGITGADRAKIAADIGRIDTDVLGSQSPGPKVTDSGDGQAVLVNLEVPANGNGNKAIDDLKAIRHVVTTGDGGLQAKVAGAGGQALDSSSAFKGIDSNLLFAAALVVALILLITYRSPILWLLPLSAVGVALACTQGLLYLLATHAGLTVSGETQGVLTVLVFGAGTDYALLLTARYREELHRHADRHQAMAVALRRAGPAVLASGSTVVISLLCLLAASLNSGRGLGPACAIGLTVALAAQLTLLPALLVTFDRWVFWPFVPRVDAHTRDETTVWGRIGGAIAARPRRTWTVAGGALVVLSVGLLQLHPTNLTEAQQFRGHPDSVVGQTLISRHFPAGASDPAYVVANADTAAAVTRAAASTPGVARVTMAGPPRQGRVLLLATFTTAPDSSAAERTVQRLRTAVHGIPGAAAAVGGSAAINLDVQQASKHDRNLIIPIVLVVVLVILGLLLRAVVAPLVLMATVIVSFAASLGASAVVFRHVFGFAGVDPGTPLLVFIFLVALGIDYNIFLMTRVREETPRIGTRAAALKALAVTGGVITSAGVVLAATFAVLALLPLTTFAEIGFAVAFGVLLDTLLVRSVVVPALTVDIGSPIWWPSRLARAEARPTPVRSTTGTIDR
jgi:putative drug exporter of the RND superfamily